MKSFAVFATVAALTWSTAGHAQVGRMPAAYVNFTSAQGQPFSLLLDGQVMTNPVARQVRLGQLAPGRHWADFTLATGYGQPVRFRTTVWLEPGIETNYLLVMQPYGPRLQRMGAVAVNGPVYGSAPGQGGGYAGSYPTPVQPGTYPAQPGTYPAPTQQGTYPVPAQPGAYPAPQQPNDYPAPAQQQGTYPTPAQPDNYPAPAQQGTYQGPPASYPAPTPNNEATPYGGNTTGSYPAPATQPGSYQPDTQQPAPEQQQAPMPDTTTSNALPPLPATEVDELTQQLHKRPSDGARLTIAKEALAQHSISAEELAQLLSTFILDKSRIDLAEYAYERVSDPENFAVVYEVFHLPASVQTLQQALGLPGQ